MALPKVSIGQGQTQVRVNYISLRKFVDMRAPYIEEMFFLKYVCKRISDGEIAKLAF